MTTGPAPPSHPSVNFRPSPPTALADVLNPATTTASNTKQLHQRDSAYFSSASTNGDMSKHTSLAQSHQNPHFISSHSSYQYPLPDNMTPSPINANGSSRPLPSPTTSGGMPLTTMVSSPMSPISDSSVDASMLAKLNPHHESRYTLTAPSSTRASVISVADSRRDSVDGRINSDFGGMRLAGNSPYASANQSTTSIQSSLQQQRNPGHLSVSSAGDRLSGNRFPSYAPQISHHRFGPSRIAPVITGPVGGPIANAEEPTKGQPWAFPDEASESRDGASSYMESRRSSIADSFASSQYTESSRMPHGQHRLEDGYPSDARLSRASSEYVVVKNGSKDAGQGGVQTHHHHHTLQTRVGELRDEEGNSPGGGTGQPYSRTPELRKSHKMAERKRRNEMKGLYDELKGELPGERGNKMSKWEVLSKSIQHHKQQEERYKQLDQFCRMVQDTVRAKDNEIERQRKELLDMKEEMRLLKQTVYGQGALAQQPQPPQNSYPHARYAEENYGGVAANGRRESLQRAPEPGSGLGLPPLRSLGAAEPPRSSTHLNGGGLPDRSFMASGGPDAMSGVQYERGYGGNYART